MRHLYARDDHGRGGSRANRVVGRDSLRAGRQSVPVHGVRRYLSGHSGGERCRAVAEAAVVRTAVSQLELRQPTSLDDALRMLRDEESLTPIAGCTDVYVSLNFGTLTGRRFIDLNRLAPLRT